jgi:signal transduction histidine kinase
LTATTGWSGSTSAMTAWGGADPGRGSGLVGLKDRVEATGGILRVESRPGQGTSLLAELPIDAAQAPDSR